MCIHTINIIQTKKKGEILTHATEWINLENIDKGNKPDTKGQIWYDSTYMEYLEQAKDIKWSGGWLPGVEGSRVKGGNWGQCSVDRVSGWEDENVLEMDGIDGCKTT